MIKFKKLHENAIIPTKGTKGSAGYDLYSTQVITLYPQHRQIIKTGIGTVFDNKIVGHIWPRSGIALKKGIDVMAGVIDSDYEGEIGVILINHGPDPFKIKVGDRIAQILFSPVLSLPVSLPSKKRGSKGFGEGSME